MSNVFNYNPSKEDGIYAWRKLIATATTYISHSVTKSNELFDPAYNVAAGSFTVLEGDSITANVDGTVDINNPTIIIIDDDSGYYLNKDKYYRVVGSPSGEAIVYASTNNTTYITRSTSNGKLMTSSLGVNTSNPLNYYASKSDFEFVDYVISNKEDTYPNNAMKDGYYYERAVISPELFGGTKIESGTFTPASNSTTYLINHTLGVIPRYSIVWAKIPTSGNIRNVMAYNVNTGSSGYVAIQNSDYYAKVDFTGSGTASTTIAGLHAHDYSSSYNFQSGIEYVYILIA